MRALQFISDHVIFKLCYNQIYQVKTPQDANELTVLCTVIIS